jgi:threonine synthase
MVGEADVLREQIGVLAVDDDRIRETIKRDFAEFGFATCPHTATATCTYRELDEELTAAHDWILVATAHPAKFETIVEPLIGASVPVPPELARLLERPAHATSIEPSLAALAKVLG